MQRRWEGDEMDPQQRQPWVREITSNVEEPTWVLIQQERAKWIKLADTLDQSVANPILKLDNGLDAHLYINIISPLHLGSHGIRS